MTEQDIQAWEREIDHAAKMQEQRNKHVVNSLLKTMVEHGLIQKPQKDNNNEK